MKFQILFLSILVISVEINKYERQLFDDLLTNYDPETAPFAVNLTKFESFSLHENYKGLNFY